MMQWEENEFHGRVEHERTLLCEVFRMIRQVAMLDDASVERSTQ